MEFSKHNWATKRFFQFSRKLKFNLISVPWVMYIYRKLERSFVRVDIKEMHREVWYTRRAAAFAL